MVATVGLWVRERLTLHGGIHDVGDPVVTDKATLLASRRILARVVIRAWVALVLFSVGPHAIRCRCRVTPGVHHVGASVLTGVYSRGIYSRGIYSRVSSIRRPSVHRLYAAVRYLLSARRYTDAANRATPDDDNPTQPCCTHDHNIAPC